MKTVTPDQIELCVSPLRVYVSLADSKAQTTVEQLNTKVVSTTDATWAADVIDQVVIGRIYGVEVLEYENVLVTKMVTRNGITRPKARIVTVCELMRAANREYGDDFDKYRTCASADEDN